MIGTNIVFDIVSHLFEGTITQEERAILDKWIAEDPKNKQLFDSLMVRGDMLEMYNMPRQHRDGRPVFAENPSKKEKVKAKSVAIGKWLKRVSVAACIVLVAGFGIRWWNDYSRVTLPELSESTLAAMRMARQTGRSDAQVTIRKGESPMNAVTISKAEEIEEESAFEELYNKLISNRAEAFDMNDMYADIVTHHDKEFWMTLPDGSRVHLNYGSSLTYPLAFTGSKREVTLEGEAYFFVTTDHRHPFIVHTRYGDVKEYGTEFCVNTRYNSTNESNNSIAGKGMSVVLVKGKISVLNDHSEYMMKPNDLAVLSSGSAKPVIKQVDTTPFTSWNAGVFTFEDCPFERLMGVISKWYGMEVNFGDKRYTNNKFTGEIDRYESLENILSSLSKSMNTDIRIEGNTIIVGK